MDKIRIDRIHWDRIQRENSNSKEMSKSPYPDSSPGTEGLSVPDDLSSLLQKAEMEEKIEDSTQLKLLSEPPATFF